MNDLVETASPIFQTPWRAPLLPFALALTFGVLVDRQFSVPLSVSLGVAAVAVLASLFARGGRERRLGPFYLVVSATAFAAAYHHHFRETIAANDVRQIATREPAPARIRGPIHTEPVFIHGMSNDPLRTIGTSDSSRFLLRCERMLRGTEWVQVSGLVLARVHGKLRDVHVGDGIEVIGELTLPSGPVNPGGLDYAGQLHDQHIGALLEVPAAAEAVSLVEQGWSGSFFGWLAVVHGWGQRVLNDVIPAPYSSIAVALLLGEGADMSAEDWEVYRRTGVVHVLAISGQHLVVLAGFFWFLFKLVRWPRRRGAIAVAAFLFLYALITGGQPPVMRSAWMVLVYCASILMTRPVMPANALALAWTLIFFWNPSDLFQSGCQLSFVAVAILFWIPDPWRTREDNPLQRVIHQSRPWLLRVLIDCGRRVWQVYIFNIVIWLLLTPLVAARYHNISPVALLIGPPVVLLSSLALLAGFALLLSAPLFWPLALFFGWLTTLALAACQAIVHWAVQLPGAYFYVSDVPAWWLGGFYAGLFCLLLSRKLQRLWRWTLLLGVAWTFLGIAVVFWPIRGGDFRCAFLSVGHGGCTVIETDDGKTLLYDAGALSGPDVARRHIAPYLWERGIRHIDEVFISHADLDHFNGLAPLFEIFRVDRITCTPTFADRTIPGSRVTLAAIAHFGVPMRIASAGDHFSFGSLTMEVMHPPLVGPAGNENSRSLVLYCQERDISFLLTGDLEGPGLARVLDLSPPTLEVLMAPHHGGKTANTPAMAKWASPHWAISCQAAPRDTGLKNVYETRGAKYLTTWKEGAVTIRREAGAAIIETFASKERWNLR